MKLAGLALALLVAVNGTLYWGLRRLESEKADLAGRRDELAQRSRSLRETGERGERIDGLLREGSRKIGELDRALDIAGLREVLLGMERGLDIDRFSLDFRSSPDVPGGGAGGGISAQLAGSFGAVHGYLARVEELRLPLAAETLTLRRDDSGRIELGIKWRGIWNGENGSLEELAPEDIADLETWLASEPAPAPSRDLFSDRAVAIDSTAEPPAVEAAPPRLAEVVPSAVETGEPVPERPRLTGFVIARPELEPDVHRRVLAAVRVEGELRLLAVGERAGPYRVEEIVAKERVLLVHLESGERLTLFLE
jgi:hypothetical protein